VRAKFEKEHNDAQRLKDQRSNIGTRSNTCLVASSEPRISHEARKRRPTQIEEESSKLPNVGQESRLVKTLNIQAREEDQTRVARAIYACGIPFNAVWSPYW